MNTKRISLRDLDCLKPEAMEARAEAGRKAIESARTWNEENLTLQYRGQSDCRINVLSLPAWLGIAERADVNFIPAFLLGGIETSQFERKPDFDPALIEFQKRCAAAVPDGHMIRYQQVAPYELKYARSEGVEPDTLTDTYLLNDPRASTTFIDLGVFSLNMYSRPMIETHDFENRPVEFRVYVQNYKVVGVSNYYPQVSLPEEYLKQARQAAFLADKMAAYMCRKSIGVGSHALYGPSGTARCNQGSFTLDFICQPDMNIIFLEGGPEGLRSAHPCCFLDPSDDSICGKPERLHGLAMTAGVVQRLNVLD